MRAAGAVVVLVALVGCGTVSRIGPKVKATFVTSGGYAERLEESRREIAHIRRQLSILRTTPARDVDAVEGELRVAEGLLGKAETSLKDERLGLVRQTSAARHVGDAQANLRAARKLLALLRELEERRSTPAPPEPAEDAGWTVEAIEAPLPPP